MRSNYKVITFFKRYYNVITHLLCNNIVITSYKCNYKIITKTVLYYIVITFLNSSYALTLNTPLIDGSLVYGQVENEEKIFIEESYLNIGKTDKNLFQIQTDSSGRFVLGIPQDTKQITLTIKTPTYSKQKVFSVSARQWDEEYVNGLPPKKVEPSKSDSQRIVTESLQMKQARQKSTYPLFPDSWQNPVPDYTRISSHFGSRRILNHIKKQGHSGTDLAAPIDTPIYAPAPGKVIFIHKDMFLTGKTILIDHGYGVFSSYSHMNHINVELNQEVKQGDLIGKVGQTGRATGPHLHWTVTWYGIRINPEDLIQKNK